MRINATLRLITPCFCAGAIQQEAEIRAPSLRGELRWWFRCVGGNKRAEDVVFGSMAGRGSAGALQVRVCAAERAMLDYSPPHAKLTDPGSYLHFYLDQPSKDGRSRLWEIPPDRNSGKKGNPRAKACFPAGSSFVTQLALLRVIPEDQEQTLRLAVDALLRFGSIGFRHTRGFGAWGWQEKPAPVSELEKLSQKLKASSPGFDFWFAPSAATTADGLLNQIENKLKAMRKPASEDSMPLPAKLLTALGHTGEHGRQASAVRFRPVQIQTKKGDFQYKLVIFQAPDRVLSPAVVEPKRLVPLLVPK